MIGMIATMTKIAVIHHATTLYVDQIKVSLHEYKFFDQFQWKYKF